MWNRSKGLSEQADVEMESPKVQALNNSLSGETQVRQKYREYNLQHSNLYLKG